jgi:hypothetical protein
MWTATVRDSPADRMGTGMAPSRQAFVVGSFIAPAGAGRDLIPGPAARIGPVYTRRPGRISITGRSPSARPFDILNPARVASCRGIGAAAVLAPCANILDPFWSTAGWREHRLREVCPGRLVPSATKSSPYHPCAQRGRGFRNVETKSIVSAKGKS